MEVFIRESKLEDFIRGSGETIFASTIHKAKGREFDNVYLIIEHYDGKAEETRELYVAMTRAKNNLNVHYCGNFLDSIKTSEIQKIIETKSYPPPENLVIQLSHKDVVLDFFASRQASISNLCSGDELVVDGDKLFTSKLQPVLKFSKKFLELIQSRKQNNYSPQKAVIRYIVFWKKEPSGNEIKIILPELYFERTNDKDLTYLGR